VPVFRELIGKHGLDMKPVDVEFLFDGGKIVFYFSAEERVDFRDLVRDLASRFKARIDMRQVGVRDEARMVGGIGHCGQMLCCVRFAGDFQPVSIRMAKEQDLPLNPLKISGLCGRLMCCLRYEYDAYKDFKSRAPKRGAMIETPVGDAKVVELNTPLETATLRMPDGKDVRVPVARMECKGDSKRPCMCCREVLEDAGAPSATLVAPEEAKPAEPRRDSGRSGESDGGQRGRRRQRRAPTGNKSGAETKAPEKKAPKAPREQQEASGAGPGAGPGAGRRRRRRRRPSGGGGQDGSKDGAQGDTKGQPNTPT
jgi:cell fate regulator YaaT (PSP1 superfamily)